MDSLGAADILAHIQRRKADGVAPASINRELALLSAAINHWNREHDANLPNPTRGRKLREPQGRVRWITRAEAAQLIRAAEQARQAPYLASLNALALHTGMRREELLGLEWPRVDLSNGLIYLEAVHTKAAARRGVGLNAIARDAILAFARYRVEHCPAVRWVVCRRDGSRVRSIAMAFNNACARAGISDFHFDDLRHTCAAWLVQAGVPLPQVRDVLAHSTITMTERYAHLAPENVRQPVQVLVEFEEDTSRSGHVANIADRARSVELTLTH